MRCVSAQRERERSTRHRKCLFWVGIALRDSLLGLESVSIHTRSHTSPCRYIHPAFMKTRPAKDKTRPRDHAQAGLVRPNRGCPVPSSKASPLGPKLATNTVRSPVRLGVLLSVEHGMGRCWEDSPERTGIAPCVTVPVKTTAVPAGACTVSVGGTAWARGNAVRATASAVAAAVGACGGGPGEPRSSADQNAVPPPLNAPLSASESATSTVSRCLSSCGKNSPDWREKAC